ncbi:MAG: CvpA family protein [Chloroflexia bacterium]|nr:CvpA family protein [Chloroflexia bacterium]
MLETLALDSLLILILLLLIPIGMYRGGLREVCSAAGVLLGLLVAMQWSDRWGGWLAGATGIDDGVARFAVAVATIVVFAGLLGYGATSSFAYSPGPGGRVFGGLIALASGVVFLGAVIQFVATYLYEGVYPDIIRDGYVSRTLSIGFDWVLLIVAGLVLVATLFGTVVRERDTEQTAFELHRDPVAARRPATVPTLAPEPVTLEPTATERAEQEMLGATAAVKIREVRHWEEPTPPTIQDLQSGWSRTWPGSVTSEPPKSARSGRGRRGNNVPSAKRKSGGSPDEAVIRDWLAEDQETLRSRLPRPVDDE